MNISQMRSRLDGKVVFAIVVEAPALRTMCVTSHDACSVRATPHVYLRPGDPVVVAGSVY